MLGLEVIFGVAMVRYNIPPIMQPLHLVTANLIFGVQFLMLIISYYATRYKGVARLVA